MQISLLSKEHPDLSYVTSSCEELFQDMSRMNDMASSVYVSRLAYNKYALPPVFSSVQLDEAQRYAILSVFVFHTVKIYLLMNT